VTRRRTASIKGVATLLGTSATALASQLPGISFFTSYAPPDFGPLTLMTGGLTLAIFAWVLFGSRAKSRGVSTGVKAVLAAVALAIVYCAILSWTTVPAPPEQHVQQRFQIGFGLLPFSLTPTGLRILQSNPDTVTTEDVLLATGGYRPNGPAVAWKQWTITAAWGTLSVIFVLSYLTWAFGLACVGRELQRRSGSNDRTPPR
jgi:hypothetical protein